jgi:hypothetical protein
VTFTATPTNGGTTPTYQWKKGTNIVGSNSANYSYTPANGDIITCILTSSLTGCSSGNPATSNPITMLVNRLPEIIGTINGQITPCKGSNTVYSVTMATNATGYAWTIPSGWLIISGQGTNSILVTVGSTSGNISVIPSNTCGNGQAVNLTVNANWINVNAGNDQTISYGSSITLSGLASNGSGNYNWHWEPASLLVNSNVQNPSTVNLTSSAQFSLTVTDISSGCFGTDQMLITVTGGVLSVDATANSNPSCTGSPVQLTAIPSGGTGNYTYNWSSNPVGFTSNISNPVVYPTIKTTYTVVVNDGFDTKSDNVEVSINNIPVVPDQPRGSDSIHLNKTKFTIYTTNSVSNTDYYIWELIPSGAGHLSSENDVSVTVTWDTGYVGNVGLLVKAVNTCGTSQYSLAKNIYVDFFTSINDVKIGNINIFPNPCDGRFTISSDKIISGVYLYDIAGRMVNPEAFGKLLFKNTQSITMDCRDLTKGMYFIRVYMGKESIVQKVIVR